MKSRMQFKRWVSMALLPLGVFSALAQQEDLPEPKSSTSSETDKLRALEFDMEKARQNDPASPRNPHRFRLQAQALWNVKLDVTNGRSNVGSGLAPGNRTYANGYVNQDNTPGDGLTPVWGYQNPSQIDAANGFVLFDAAASGGAGRVDNFTDGPHPGFELSYGFEMARVWGGYAGFELGFGYTDISFDGLRTQRITDAYSLAGAVPPAAPYAGNLASPVQIADTFTRGITNTTLDWESSLYALRLGPFIEWELTDRLTAGLSGGPWLAFVDSRANIRESTSYGAFTNVRSTNGTTSASEFGFGLYADGRLAFELTENWEVFGGVRYQFLDNISLNSGIVSAEMKMSQSVNTYLGFGFSF